MRSKIIRIITVLLIALIFIGLTGCIKGGDDEVELRHKCETENLINESNDIGKIKEATVKEIKADDGENFISYDERLKSLESIMKNYYTKFELGTKCNSEKIYFDKQKNMVSAYVDIIAEDISGRKESLNEVIFFKKVDNKWKIYKIESNEDVLLPYRTYSFSIS